jgi:hypothetical protein
LNSDSGGGPSIENVAVLSGHDGEVQKSSLPLVFRIEISSLENLVFVTTLNKSLKGTLLDIKRQGDMII